MLQEHSRFALVGASLDGGRAVLGRTERRTTTLAILSPRRETTVYLPGNNWSFVALTGSSLYLRRNGELWRDGLGGAGNHPIAALATDPVQVVSDGQFVLLLSVSSCGVATVVVLDCRARNCERGPPAWAWERRGRAHLCARVGP